MSDKYEYIGCIHVHSIFSDGSGTYPEIIRAAKEAGLDFLMVSDHMTLEGKNKGFEGWYDKLLVLIGYEINDPQDRHHYLAFGIDEILPENYTHEEYIKSVEKLHGLGIAAHPFEERQSEAIPGFPAITWDSLDYPEIRVIELWNMMSHWLESTTLKNLFWNLVHPRSFSTIPAEKLSSWWDKTNLKRKVTAVGSVDVHAKKIKILGLFPKAIFDYKIMFKSLRTHVLTDKPVSPPSEIESVQKVIFKSLTDGNCFISNYRWGDARGFRFWVETENGKAEMGDICRADKAIIRINIPEDADCKIVRNGKLFDIAYGKDISFEVSEGIYRAEIEKDGRGWIYTNHIRVEGK